jgi:phage shock protein PspC (stress-responsive transcriptional regulator)
VTDRLYRSRDDRILAGVAGGLAENLDTDPSIIRIVWALLVVLTGGIALVVYIIMAIVVPERPEGMPVQGWSAAPWTPTAPGSGDAGSGARPDVGPGSEPDPAPVPEGSWRGPDGTTVPLAAGGTAPHRRPRDPADRTPIALLAGLLLIVLGGYFLIRRFIPDIDPWFWWPLLAVAAGVVLLVVALLPPRRPR